MAFQAGGAHALDRALEAIAIRYDAMTPVPASVSWEKPRGKASRSGMEKTFTVVPRGIALVIGCTTFPTWNSYPGLFASLVTGNPVIVKPHPRAVLPLAITVGSRDRCWPSTASTATWSRWRPRTTGAGLASVLATRPEVRIDRLHRVDRVRRVARGARPAGGGVHREGRRQRRRHRLDVRSRRHGRESRLLARALQRPDVHDAAGLAHPCGRHRGRRRPNQCRRLSSQRSRDALDHLLGEPARATAILGAIGSDHVLDTLAAQTEGTRRGDRIPVAGARRISRGSGAHTAGGQGAGRATSPGTASNGSGRSRSSSRLATPSTASKSGAG